MLSDACDAEDEIDLDELERSADAYRMTEVRVAVSRFDRATCVRVLESISIQCYDHEDVATLRTAVITNVEDGTLSPKDLLAEGEVGGGSERA